MLFTKERQPGTVPRARRLGFFRGPFGELFWDQIGQRGAKMGSRGPSRGARYRKHSFAKTFKIGRFLKVFVQKLGGSFVPLFVVIDV